MRYEVRAGDRAIRMETTGEGRLLVDGHVVAYDARDIVAGRHWSIVVEGRAHEVVRIGGGAPARWLVDGTEVLVTTVDERALAARRDRVGPAGGRHEVRAPMAGLLMAVHVSEGDIVERHAAIATLEAMKMENELRAPVRARVQRVAASPGAKVDSGSLIAVLVEETA